MIIDNSMMFMMIIIIIIIHNNSIIAVHSSSHHSVVEPMKLGLYRLTTAVGKHYTAYRFLLRFTALTVGP